MNIHPKSINATPRIERFMLSFLFTSFVASTSSMRASMREQSSFIVVKFFCTVKRIALSMSSQTSSIALGIGTVKSSRGR